MTVLITKLITQFTLMNAALLALVGCVNSLASSTAKAPEIVVLYTSKDPIIPKLPENCCEYIPLEDFKPDSGRQARTVIVGGHGQPPEYAGHSYQEVADAVAALKPELVVMNSCYGASTDILGALASHGLDAYVVAAPFTIYKPGFTFEPSFFKGTPKEKIMAVHTDPPYPILRWKIKAEDLKQVHAQVDKLPREELLNRLRRVQPALVRMPMPNALGNQSEVLVPLPAERFR